MSMIQSSQKKIIIAILLIAIGVIGRLVPHMWNVTPIVAIALFSGAYLSRRYMILVPITAMLIADAYIGFYDIWLQLAVYGSFGLVGIFSYLTRHQKSVATVLFASVSASTLFFLITNFVVWKITPWYSSDIVGLMQSYTLAIPFFRNMVIGDLVFTGVFFGVYELATKPIYRTVISYFPSLLSHNFLTKAKNMNYEQ